MNLFLLCISFASLLFATDELDLGFHEKKIYSQNGEDGVLEKIFEVIGTTSKYYVEFGEPTGDTANTRLLRESGWNGLLMDAAGEDLRINLRKEWITAENIQDLFFKYNVPLEFDLLSIDMDFNDFYIWQKISEKYRPRVVIIEHNATHLPFEDKVIIYNPSESWDGTNYFGASLLAFYKLGQKIGYSLVYSEENGVNLFFIRDDILDKQAIQFKHVNCPELIYKYPHYGSGPNRGHTMDPQLRPYTSAGELLSP